MQLYKQVKQEISNNSQLKMLTQAYQEHAISQINTARYSVVASRAFMQELDEIFFNVKTSYKTSLAQALQARKKQKNANLQKNGKDALVLLSSNGKFYGDLVTKVCRLFVKAAQIANADIIIIGRVGKKFYEQSGNPKPYTYFDLSDTNISLTNLKPLIQYLIPYENSTIFFGRFNNIALQEPVKVGLTGELSDEEVKNQAQLHNQENFLFEPSLEQVLEFFETQIFSLILSQTVNEGKLARFGSRVTAMESAKENLRKQLSLLIHKERRLKAMEINKKQLQLFAGRSLWNKS